MSLFKLIPSFSRDDGEVSTPFAEFIRSAPAGEKKKVYSQVLREASEIQNELTEKAKASRRSRSKA